MSVWDEIPCTTLFHRKSPLSLAGKDDAEECDRHEFRGYRLGRGWLQQCLENIFCLFVECIRSRRMKLPKNKSMGSLYTRYHSRFFSATSASSGSLIEWKIALFHKKISLADQRTFGRCRLKNWHDFSNKVA